MSTLSSVEQKVYKKVMASKKRAMTQSQIEAAIPGLSKKDCQVAINKILHVKLFTASRNPKGELTFHAVAVEDARKQNTLTEEQQYVLSIVEKAGNTGISKPSIANQVNAEIMARMQVFRALEALEKVGLVKTFKGVNAPTMPLYILAHLKPPEDIAGGIWFDESKEYDSVFVDTLRGVVLNYIQQKTFPQRKSKDDISKLCANPIYPISKTAALPTPAAILAHLQKNKVTSAPLTVKNVMEIARALELDGLIESIKPVGGVSVDPVYESDSDGEPAPKRRRSKFDDDDMDPEEAERRERKEREKMKAKLKEAKREKQRKERAREKEKERERKRKEKEKERKRKEKERKRKAKEKERARKDKERSRKKKALDSDLDNSDEELRELDEVKPKRKRRVVSDESDLSDSDSSSASDSDSDSDSDSSDSDSSDSDVSVSSVDSDDLDNVKIDLKPQSSAAALASANPFFSDTGRQTLIDLSDQAVLYRAMHRLTISLGQMQAPCGTCPQFNFCEEGGPVNADSCLYYSDWLAGTGGGWTADVKAEKAKKAEEEEKARRRAIAEANGETYVEEAPEPNGEEAYEEDAEEYGDYDETMNGEADE